MKKHTDIHTDDLVDKIMKMSSPESPSSNFTDSVMSRIENIPVSSITSYKPLISKWFWLFVGLIVFLIYLYMAFQATAINYIDFSVVYDNKFVDVISSIAFSKATTYGLLLTALMFLIQISLLKYYFNKRLV